MKLHLRLFALLMVMGVLLAVCLPTFAAPRGVILLEGFTQWNCGPCAAWNPQERSFLTAMTRDTVIAIKYHAWWPGSNNDAFYLWNVAENNARINYYGVNAVPTVVIDGNHPWVGPSSGSITAMRSTIRSRFATEAPCAIDLFTSPQPGDTTIHYTAVVHAEQNISNMTLYAADITNSVQYQSPPGTNGETLFDDVFRDLGPTQTGMVVNIPANTIYTFAGTVRKATNWDPADLSVVVWLQASNREIDQAVWTEANGEFDMAASAGSASQMLIAPGGTAEYRLSVQNLGVSADVYHVIPTGSLPAGWTQTFTASGLPPSSDSLLLPLDAQSADTVIVTVNANGNPGTLSEVLTVSSPNAPGLMSSVNLRVLSGLDMLVVDDDGGSSFEHYYSESLTRLVSGHSWGVWDETMTNLDSPDMLEGVNTIVWFTGSVYPNTLSIAERGALSGWLDEGNKNLILSGQGIGQDLRTDTLFFRDYLHASYHGNFAAGTSITGVEGDPVGDGLGFDIAGGDGAANQTRQTVLLPDASGLSTACMSYNDTLMAALRVETPLYKAVYMGFGFEAINSAPARDTVMARCLDWVWASSGVNDPHQNTVPTVFALGQNFPNPFNPETTIPYALPARASVTLRVFDVLGRQVAELVNGMQEAGSHSAVWKATDFSSGVYFYRLEASAGAQSFRATHKLVVLK